MRLRHKVLGPEHPDTLRTMHNLSISYGAVGRLDEAIKTGEETLQLNRKVLADLAMNQPEAFTAVVDKVK